MASTTGGDNAKLSSLFNKKKKGGIKSMNANAIAQAGATAAPVAAAAAPSNSKAKTTASNMAVGSPPKPQAPTKTVSELTIGDKKEQDEKREFQWAKQPKKYKNTAENERVAKTWEEQEERNRVSRRINLGSERAFPTLGADATQVQLSTMKAPQSKAVATKNVWSTLNHDEDEDEEDDE